MQYISIKLDERRARDHGQLSRDPFQHQIEAFEALSKVFTFSDNKAKSGLLVFPTGAGKTFTAVKWLCDNALPRNVRIIWLAHSFYLLDQAFSAFYRNASWIPEPRRTVNIRLVSSNPSHAKASSIQLTDDIVIMTTQTAIRNLHTNALDNSVSGSGCQWTTCVERSLSRVWHDYFRITSAETWEQFGD